MSSFAQFQSKGMIIRTMKLILAVALGSLAGSAVVTMALRHTPTAEGSCWEIGSLYTQTTLTWDGDYIKFPTPEAALAFATQHKLRICGLEGRTNDG